MSILLLCFIFGVALADSDCRNLQKDHLCEFYKENGHCKTSKRVMKSCKRSCDVCDGIEPDYTDHHVSICHVKNCECSAFSVFCDNADFRKYWSIHIPTFGRRFNTPLTVRKDGNACTADYGVRDYLVQALCQDDKDVLVNSPEVQEISDVVPYHAIQSCSDAEFIKKCECIRPDDTNGGFCAGTFMAKNGTKMECWAISSNKDVTVKAKITCQAMKKEPTIVTGISGIAKCPRNMKPLECGVAPISAEKFSVFREFGLQAKLDDGLVTDEVKLDIIPTLTARKDGNACAADYELKDYYIQALCQDEGNVYSLTEEIQEISDARNNRAMQACSDDGFIKMCECVRPDGEETNGEFCGGTYLVKNKSKSQIECWAISSKKDVPVKARITCQAMKKEPTVVSGIDGIARCPGKMKPLECGIGPK